MAQHLVVARCGRSPLLMGDTEALSEEEQEALLDPVSADGEAALALALPGGRWAIGRRTGARCVWWVGDDFPTDPPHGLWTEPSLFSAEGDAVIPTIEPAALISALSSVVSLARAAKVVAGAVRLLRESDAPLCIVAAAPQPALEALALTVVAAMGGGISVAVGHPEPDPQRYRLAVGPTVLDGYEPVRAADPPDEQDDLVAWYVRDRLGVEPEAAFVSGGITEDGVREVLRSGSLSASSGLEGRVRAVTARIRAGAELDEALLDELLAVTELAADARPWIALQRRPSVVRRAAAEAALEIAPRLRPTRALLEALSAVYPRGAPLAPWCSALLDWVRRASVPEPFVAALERALEEWPQSATQANRVSVWTEVVHILVEREMFRLAQSAVTGRVAQTLVREGSGGAIAALWGTLPADRRNPRRLAGLVEMLVRHPQGDRAAGQLYLHVRGNQAEVDALVKKWVRTRGSRSTDEDDGLLQVLVGTEHLPLWLECAFEVHPEGSVTALLPRIAKGPEDPLWLEAEAALAKTTPSARRFANLASLTSGLVALEPLARALIEDALDEARFPDARMAETARLLVEVPGSAAMWPWIAVAASAPGRFEDELIDGTVVALCEVPPTNGIERQVCARAAELLGAAADWEPLDHARWVVRLALAPDGDQTGFNETLVQGLVAGLATRFDAGPHVAGMTIELLQLPPDHAAVSGFLSRWLPQAWASRVPAAFVEAVEAHGVPEALAPFWERLVS